MLISIETSSVFLSFGNVLKFTKAEYLGGFVKYLMLNTQSFACENRVFFSRSFVTIYKLSHEIIEDGVKKQVELPRDSGFLIS